MRDKLNEWYKRFFDEASDEMKAAILAGIPIDFTSERTDSGGIRVTGTTRYPCALVGDTLYYRRTEDDQ